MPAQPNADLDPPGGAAAPAPAGRLDALVERHGGAVVAAVALLAYAGTLSGGFVWDDLYQVVQNPWIRDWRLVGQAFTSHLAAFSSHHDTSFYRPLVHLLDAALYAAFGLAPWAYHLANVLFHAGATLALHALLRRWSLAGWPALLGALLFAVHPVHVEPVAWVTGVFDVACGLFFLLGLVALAEERPARWLWAVPCFAAALLWKEPAMAFLPVALTLLLARGDLVARRRPTLLLLALLGLVTIGYLALRIHALGGLVRSHPGAIHLPAGQALLTGVSLLGHYARLLVIPVGLGPIHDLPPVTTPGDPAFAGGLLAIALLAWGAWRARRSPEILAGLALLVFPLLPALYLPALRDLLVAERYLYLPSAGAAALVATALRRWPGRLPRAAALAGAAAFLAGTAVGSAVWHDELSLWQGAVSHAPRSAVAHEALGYALISAGRSPEAIPVLSRALELDPDRLDARTNLAVALASAGRLAEAEAQADQVLRRRPREVNALLVRAAASAARGQLAQAVAAYEQALAIEPGRAPVHNAAGIACAQLGWRDQAARHFGAAARLDPGNPEYARNLAAVLR